MRQIQRLAFILALFTLAAGCSGRRYDVASYQGDGVLQADIEDGQVLYRLTLPEFPAGFSGVRRYRMAQLPEGTLSLRLEGVLSDDGPGKLTEKTELRIDLVEVGTTESKWMVAGPITRWQLLRIQRQRYIANIDLFIVGGKSYELMVNATGEPVPFKWRLVLDRVGEIIWP